MINRIERHLARFAMPHLTLLIVAGQAAVFMLVFARPELLQAAQFVPSTAVAGEPWRFITFCFVPPTMSPLWLFFALYFFFLMGTALENRWGSFRYNVFLLAGYAATVGAAFVMPDLPATNVFIGGSVFLAFARLYPDFVIYLFFVLPVKIKWLAWASWGFFFLAMVAGTWEQRAPAIAAVANFLLFFGRDIVLTARYGARRMKAQLDEVADRNKPFHTCHVCGATDKSHPQMEFRYCSECDGTPCYCAGHIDKHEHVRNGGPGTAR